MKKLPILIILGPTATGKSDLAVRLAKKIKSEHIGGYNGAEIISADSRQVYKGLNIGTGKITKREMQNVPHHLLDVADPKKRFTVVDFKLLAERAIRDITSRGKLPIICGGTGFYIDSVVNDREFPSIKANENLWARLAKKSAVQLLEMLRESDPARARQMAANDSECHNSRRLIRAIEIAKYMDQVIKMTGRHVPKSQAADESTTREATQMPSSRNNYDSLFIGIKVPPIELRDRIHKRLIKRLKIGMLTEAKHLHEPRTNSNPNGGLSWKRMNELGLEYRYEAEFIQGRLTRDLFIEVLSTKIWQYSRRQMTWFKRNGKIKWFKSDRIRSIETYIDHKINTNVALFKAPRRR